MLTTETGAFQDKRESYQGSHFVEGQNRREATPEVVNGKGLENSVL